MVRQLFGLGVYGDWLSQSYLGFASQDMNAYDSNCTKPHPRKDVLPCRPASLVGSPVVDFLLHCSDKGFHCCIVPASSFPGNALNKRVIPHLLLKGITGKLGPLSPCPNSPGFALRCVIAISNTVVTMDASNLL